jgi:hypothetical protein
VGLIVAKTISDLNIKKKMIQRERRGGAFISTSTRIRDHAIGRQAAALNSDTRERAGVGATGPVAPTFA